MAQQEGLPQFHPQTVLRDWRDDNAFRISDALTGVCVFGATGSGKTSGPAKHLAYGYLVAGFGGLVLCAKKEERRQWEKWAAETGRTQDLVIFDVGGKWRFNFMDWEASRSGDGGGLTINIVAMLSEIVSAVAGAAGESEGGDNKFWEDSLRHMLANLVDLALLAGLPVRLPLLRDIVVSAPMSLEEARNRQWMESSVCARTLAEADGLTRKADADIRADFDECSNYWLKEFAVLSDKTRSIITLCMAMLARPFVTRPLRKLFSSDTNIAPEAAFDGKIIVVDLPVQEFKLAGRFANLVIKYCFQAAVLRRSPPTAPGQYVRPVFLYADEAQYFITKGDAEYQAVARSAGGCTIYMTQNRESYRRVLGDNDAVDSLLANLQMKFFCQNSGDTNTWASSLFGQRWVMVTQTSVGQGQRETPNHQETGNHNSSVSRQEQLRNYVEPSRFTTLKRGGERNNCQVETIVYAGGAMFAAKGQGGETHLPYKLLKFDQR